ncbi:MAG: hypothetical protein ACE5EH_08535 [Gammaproteobacteria bacterium]
MKLLAIRKLAIIPLLAAIGLSQSSWAGSNDITLTGSSITQTEFNSLIEELGTAVSYNSISPAETLGTVGFDVGVSLSVYDVDKDLWNLAVSDADAPSSLPVPRLMVRKGLPFGVDVGASYVKVPGSNIANIGGEVRKSILEGSTLTPAVSITGHASRLSGVDDINLSTYGLDVGISKGFANLTPYAGVGQMWFKGKEEAGIGLSDQDASETRSYIGLRVGILPILNVVGQADFANVNSYSLRLNLGF